MNPRNPIDDLFRQRLREQDMPAPMHLWAEIDRKRSGRHRLRRRLQRNQATVLLLLFFLLGGSAGAYFLLTAPPEIRYFPITVPETRAAPEATAETDLLPSRSVAPPESVVLKAGSPSEAGAVTTALPAAAIQAEPTASPAAGQSGFRTVEKVVHTPPPSRSIRKTVLSTIQSLPTLPAMIVQDPQCVEFGKAGNWKLYADASAGPNVAFQQLKSKSSEFDQLADERRATESPGLSFSSSLRLSLVSDFGLAVRTGLSYSQINDRFSLNDPTKEKITITTVYGSDGDVIGTDTLVEAGHKVSTGNHYRMLDIPLLLGYEIQRNKWTIALNGGPYLNVLFRPDVTLVSEDNLLPTKVSRSEGSTGEVFRREIGVSWYGSLGFHYQLKEGLQLLLEPHLRYFPRSFTRDEYPVGQQYLTTGLSIGLRKQI